MDKLRSMRIFVEIAEKGSLTAAADATGKSVPTVVRTLAKLEETLSVRLFNRTTRRVVLTEEGRAYLPQCRKILSDIDEAERALGQSKVEPSGSITVTAPVLFGEMHVAPAVARFLRQYPKARVDLMLFDRVVDLLEEGVDVAVRIAHLEDSTLIARPVGATRQVVCASPHLVEAEGKPTHPVDLTGLPCIEFTGVTKRSEWPFDVGGNRATVPIEPRLTCNQVAASIEACVQGAGFGRFLCYQVAPFVNAGKLVTVLDEFALAATPLSLVYPHSRLLSARVRAMVDWLAGELASSLAVRDSA